MHPQEKQQELSQALDMVIDQAIKAGADDVFASSSFIDSSKINYEKNDFNSAGSHEGVGVSLTVHKDQKAGATSINTLNPGKVAEAIDRALTLAKYSVADEYLGLAGKSEYVDLLFPFDEALDQISMGKMRELSELLMGGLLSDKRISIDSASIERSSGVRVIANSKGMRAFDRGSSLTWSMMGMGIDGDDITSFDYISDFSYFLAKAPEKILKSTETFKEKLINCLGAGQGESYKGQVLLSPALVDELLIEPLIYHMLGANIMDGKSKWEQSLHEKVAPENLTIEDHPHDLTLRGCTPFSGEGVPTQEMTLVGNGVLQKHLDSVYTANRRGTKPTGNGGGPHCTYVKPGSKNLSSLRAMSDILLEPSRFSGNMDPVTGDFSGVAKGSQFYKKGEKVGPVKEMMISGNLFQVLDEGLTLGEKCFSDGGCYLIPHILLDGVSVTSG
ncbi:MAG: TldD/PmbA family protein [Planctomycetes bacterium]|nr:TldD/PmbA family protein [Planctomycetota bacterium]